ncbi:MAG: hypothetical protein K6F57_03135 [Candidatus Saccharibacteria bacterium]|nr:hypothetical protein [Candidatus Saccharibacteria bacterium]
MMSNVIEMIYANGCKEGSHEYGTSRDSYQDMIRDINRAADEGQIGRVSGVSAADLEMGAGGYVHLSDKARKLLG